MFCYVRVTHCFIRFRTILGSRRADYEGMVAHHKCSVSGFIPHLAYHLAGARGAVSCPSCSVCSDFCCHVHGSNTCTHTMFAYMCILRALVLRAPHLHHMGPMVEFRGAFVRAWLLPLPPGCHDHPQGGGPVAGAPAAPPRVRALEAAAMKVDAADGCALER